MRSSTAARAVTAIIGIAIAGCYSPSIEDGTLSCADGRCPRGFMCGSDKLCHAGGPRDAAIDLGTESHAVDSHGDAGAGGSAGVGGSVGTGKGGAGGVAGTSGAAGTGGVAGTSGVAGTTGVAGTSGAAGRGGGSAGTGAIAGTGGSAGAGRGGTGGGTGGIAGTTGRGGGAGGIAGTSGSAGTDGAAGAAPGTSCDVGTQCASGFCVDGVCCNIFCTERCKACDVGTSRGVCTQVTSGPPHGKRDACAGTGMCAGACSAASATACSYPAADVTCRAASCTGATLTLRAGCDAAGSCPAVATMSCGDLVCNANGTACLTSCTLDAQCAAPARPYCDAGGCVAARSNGAACQSTRECASGRCVDGVCCSDACTAPCQACDVQGHVGTCWPVSTGTPRGGRPGCGGTGVCAGYCNGLASGQCFFPGAETTCPCGLLGGTCNQAGSCQTVGGICL